MPDGRELRPEPGTLRTLGELAAQLNRPLQPDEKIDEAALREVFGQPAAQTMDPESFRELLVQQGFYSALAAKIKALLKSPDVLERFLRPKAPARWSTVIQTVWGKFLVEEIGRILSAANLAESEENWGKFRRLCRLAVEWGIDPETYRQILVAAGLAKSRASELKRVLECPAVCAAFVDEAESKTWNEALLEARQLGQSPEELGAHQLTLLARKLIRLVVRHMEMHEGRDFVREEFQIYRSVPGSFILVHVEQGSFKLILERSLYRPLALPQAS